MVLGCGAKFFKYCLFAFNMLFFIAGAVCLGVGIWFLVDDKAAYRLTNITENSTVDDLENRSQVTRNAGIIMCVCGAIIFVIAFLGCCGAIKEWRPLLVLYAVFLLMILAVELAAAIYAGINRENIETQIRGGLQKSLTRFYNSTDNPVKKAWDQTMEEFECCGVNADPRDFVSTDWRKKSSTHFPPKCCKTQPCAEANIYPTGCFTAIKDSLRKELGIVIGVAIAVSLIQFIGIIFALCLCKSIEDVY